MTCRVSLCLTVLFCGCATVAFSWFVTPASNPVMMMKRQQNSRPFIIAHGLLGRVEPNTSDDDYYTTGTSHHQVEAILSSGLDPEDLSLVMEAISHECRELGVSLLCDDSTILSVSSPVIVASLPGALGRILVLRASSGVPQDLLEDLECGICEQMDHLMMQDPPALTEAVLISFQIGDDDLSQLVVANNNNDKNDDYTHQYLAAILEAHVQDYNMASRLLQTKDHAQNGEETSLVPSIHVEIDGGYVSYPFNTSPVWDTSTLLVFDNLVSDDLRKRLLDVVLGKNSDQDDARNGPDPLRWVRGGLLDVPDNPLKQEPEESNNSHGGGWGLTDEGLEEICFELHDAVQEMESILSDLFPDFSVARLPEVVLGCSVTPITANAPTAGDIFGYHIDADPNIAPASPWTDMYGRYPNRAAGKPRFMSFLVYLNDEWDGDTWGAPTRFVDVPTDEDLTVYDVQACPGRCIIMDQDVGHTVVAPTAAAGKRPRYSMVWKLILHPKTIGQDMKHLAGRRKSLWPETDYFGSAAQNHGT
jgi:hypothetical protein